MRILGIETSCDETGFAVYDSKQGLMAHQLHSQVARHAQYGGVVPELASRDHVQFAVPLLKKILSEINLTLNELDGIAYTAGPGLMGALLVGSSFAKALSYGLDIPCLAVHHMEGHLLAPMLEEQRPAFPFLALLVSGGHTMLVDVQGIGAYTVLGETLDDAVGEAFDKTAKMMGLPYPGGPHLEQLAKKGTPVLSFPRPMTDRPGVDFSFSGLKTFTMNALNNPQTPQWTADIARSFQDAVIDTLTIKCRRAIQQTGCKRLVVAGGVSANLALRQGFQELAKDSEVNIFFPRHQFCTDNGAMIAYAGCIRMLAGQYDDGAVAVRPRWPLKEVLPCILAGE